MLYRVSYTLRDQSTPDAHCFGVNTLARSPDGTVYTGGRDSSIRSWNVSRDTILHKHLYQGHTDWVNDITLVLPDKLLSCSSDGSVRLWSTETAETMETYSWHTDYVKALSSSSVLTQAASTGLDGQLVFWDIEKSSESNEVREPIRKYALEASGYSVHLSMDATLLACGTTSKHVSLFDTRMTKRLHNLKGHEDNIKALVMDVEGRRLISGGSDRSIKLWDLRNPSKPLSSLDVHEDSVWSLWVDPVQFNVVYSGSRDGTVYKTYLTTEKSTLLFTEKEPILKILPDLDTDTMWVSTTENLHEWKIEEREKPARCFPRRAGIIEYKCISDRRKILTKDSDGYIQQWDVCSGACTSLGNGHSDSTGCMQSLADIAPGLETKNWVQSWFTVSVKTGSLVLHLDYPSCFDAEVFAEDLGIMLPANPSEKKLAENNSAGEAPPEKTENLLDETTVNLGAHVLDALFKEWVKGHAEIHRRKEETKEGELATLGPHESEDNRKVNFTTTEWEEQKKEKKRAKIQKKERERVKEKTRPFFFPPNTQITISEVNTKSDISRGLYSKTVAEFSGKEKIPKWVFQALLHNMFRCRVSPKVVFSITSTGPDLALIKKKFTAIRLLPVSRIIAWIGDNIELPPHAPTTDKRKFIEILCNGKVVPSDINLATVLQLYWRSSNKALTLEFRVNLDHSGL